jgi:hypothetical protein
MIYVSDWLNDCLMRARNQGGAGLGVRPEFYSGRGAKRGDLPTESLERIYEAIQIHKGKHAAKQFAQMVADIPSLSATDFLINLERLHNADFVWRKEMLANTRGVYATSFGSALGTVMEGFHGGFVCSYYDDEPEPPPALALVDLGDDKKG